MKWQLGEDYKELGKEIGDLEDEVRHCWSRLKYPSRSFAGERRKSSGDSMGNGIAAVIDMEEELNRKIEEFKALRLEIEATIDSLSSYQRRLMRMRYIRGFTWQQIAQRLYCDESTCRRIHRNILRSLQ